MDYDNFDIHANSYEEILNKSLEFTGANGHYFAERKIHAISKFYTDTITKPPLKILEFGCGTGNNLSLCSSYFGDSTLYGVDISKKSIEIAKERNISKCSVTQCSTNDIPYQDHYFDLIIVINVFHHIEKIFHENTLSLIRKKLNRSGLLIIFEHNPINPLTRKFVRDCPLDDNVTLLRHTYTKQILENQKFRILSTRFISFLPPLLARYNHVENYLTWFKLGAQYGVFSVKQ